LFAIFYLLAKHRGYKSLDSDDLLEELLLSLGYDIEEKKAKKDDEKGEIKKALQIIESLKEQYPDKTVAQIIYEVEITKTNPTFRNHNNYRYMIRREYIREEIEKIIKSQEKFGFFDDEFDIDSFIKELISTIDDQKESTNDRSLFSDCQYYPEHKVAHQYSLLSDIFKMYQSVANIKLNKESITKEQIALVADDFFKRLKIGKNIIDIEYQDIRKILKLSDEIKIFGKADYYLDKKGKKSHHAITKFHFVSNLTKIDNSFIINALQRDNSLEIFKEIFDVVEFEKSPKSIYEKLYKIFDNYHLVDDEKSKIDTIISIIRQKSGNSMNISPYAMIKFVPYFEDGLTTDEIKKILNLDREEDYSRYKKGIKHLHISTFEADDNLTINNHPVKSIVSANIRLLKHLHSKYGVFDEIRVESR